MDVVIRLASASDSEPISQLSHQLGYSVSNQEASEKLVKILTNENHCILIATMDNKAVGWLHGFYLPRLTSEPFAEIAAMVVDEAHRDKGIGKKLVDAAKNWAKEKGINTLRVRCNIVRTDTHQFYQNLGFVEQKEQKVLDLKLS